MRVGVDTGGTFTDVVADDGTVAKVPSTPDDPGARGARRRSRPRAAARDAGGARPRHHGGHQRAARAPARPRRAGDHRGLRRRDRDRPPGPSVALRPVRRPAAAAGAARAAGSRWRAGSTRTGASSSRSTAWSPTCGATSTRSRCACSTPTSTRRTSGRWRRCSARVATTSCARTRCRPSSASTSALVTTVVNAYLRPVCRAYLRSLAPIADEVSVMTSAGGLVPLAEAAAHPARLLLSGPGGRRAGRRRGRRRRAASPTRSRSTWAARAPTCAWCSAACPSPPAPRRSPGSRSGCRRSTIHTIGAGGGSIARLDPGGALAVGPESAGAEPGPACYGRGGTAPTVTDADLVLGRIPAGDRAPRARPARRRRGPRRARPRRA